MLNTALMPTAKKPTGRPTKIVDAEKYPLRLSAQAMQNLRDLSLVTGASINDLIVLAVDALYQTHPKRDFIEAARSKEIAKRKP